jgi:hypothetical protein
MNALQLLSEMSQEEQMKTPLGHLFQAITPLCHKRKITDPELIGELVVLTMDYLDKQTLKILENESN